MAPIEITVNYFKDNGKFYTENAVTLPDKNMQVYEIIQWLRENAKCYKGMHLVAMLGELEHSCPVMIPARDR